MGANQSTGDLSHTRRVAAQSYQAARLHHDDVRGPKPTGAILDYIDQGISATRCIKTATPLEVNEFKKLLPKIYARWHLDRMHKFKCLQGSCQGEMNHLEHCPLRNSVQHIPEDIRVSKRIMKTEYAIASAEGHGRPDAAPSEYELEPRWRDTHSGHPGSCVAGGGHRGGQRMALQPRTRQLQSHHHSCDMEYFVSERSVHYSQQVMYSYH